MIQGAIVTEDAISVTINCKPYTIRKSHNDYEAVLSAVRDNDSDTVMKLINFNSRVQSDKQIFDDYLESIDSNGQFEVTDYTITFNGEEIGDALVKKLKQLYEIGLKEHVKHYIEFIINLYENPSYQSIQELYLFLDRNGLPITEDGHFIAYKSVRNDYLDKYSSTVDNSVGNIISMPRFKVDDDRDRTCSEGYHVGAWEYAGKGGWFNNSDDRVVLVKVNPRDAVSVPSDHSDQKLRVCRYEVVDEYEQEKEIDSPVYYNDRVAENALEAGKGIVYDGSGPIGIVLNDTPPKTHTTLSDVVNVSARDEEDTDEEEDVDKEVNYMYDYIGIKCEFSPGKSYEFDYRTSDFGSSFTHRRVTVCGEYSCSAAFKLVCSLLPGDASYDSGFGEDTQIRCFSASKIKDFKEIEIEEETEEEDETHPIGKKLFTYKKGFRSLDIHKNERVTFEHNGYYRSIEVVDYFMSDCGKVVGYLLDSDPFFNQGLSGYINQVVTFDLDDINGLEFYKKG